jgi:hypothetical protein
MLFPRATRGLTRRRMLGVHAGGLLAVLMPRVGRSATPPATRTYDLVQDFGARPGTASASVSATTRALMAFHVEAGKRTNPTLPGAYADARWDTHIVLNISAGTFRHTYNRFGMGIKYLTLHGAGKTRTFLQNSNITSWYDAIAFRSCAPDYFNDPDSPLNLGYYIYTAEADATSVVLKSPAYAGAVPVGKWVLVMSMSRQLYGWPPAMSRYEWAKVTSKDGATIRLDRPLTMSHRDDCPTLGVARDAGNSLDSAGPAAIVAIDTDRKPVGELHIYEGFTALAHPKWDPSWGDPVSTDVFQILGCIEARVVDCDFENAVGMTQIKSLTLTGCSYKFDESDKLIGQCSYVDCQVAETVGHTQQLQWTVEGGQIGTVTNMSAVKARLYKVAVMNHIALDSAQPTDECILDSVMFAGGDHDDPIASPNPAPYTFTVGRDVQLVNTTELRVRKTGIEFGQPFTEITTRWGIGHTVNVNGAFVEGSTLVGVTGDDTFIHASFSGISLKLGDRVWVAPLRRLVVRNCIGRGTRRQWSVPFVHNIPEVVWQANSGD